MFPESFAETWIDKLSSPGDVVLDPFSGRGTTPFQALLMRRIGIGVDINPVAACLNFAKLEAPTRNSIKRRLRQLREGFDPGMWRCPAQEMGEFFHFAYDIDVLSTLLYLRSELSWKERRVDAFIAALVLGSLHGEASSRRYLSNQMPRTISTKPGYSVRYWRQRQLHPPRRDVFAVLSEALDFRYASPLPAEKGRAIFGDMRDLPHRWTGPKATLVVTSPPYGAVTSYEEDQWLRLWFLGGPEKPGKARITRDDRRQTPEEYWRFIGDLWRALSFVLEPEGNIVIRIGTVSAEVADLERQLKASFALSPRPLSAVSTHISEIRKRQTESFRPGSRGCVVELDMHAVML
jgi:hypothetical protein